MYGLPNVKKTALILHEKNVFSSKTIAQQYFQAAIQSAKGSLDAAPCDTASIGKDMQLSAETKVPPSAQHKGSPNVTPCDPTLTHKEIHPSAEARVPPLAQHKGSPDVAPCDPASIDKEIQLSAETRVPLSAQHHLLAKVRLELEAACFEFARARMPAILEQNDWTCAEAAELNLIARALGKHQEHLPGVARLPKGVTAGKLLGAVGSIRHAAVHREYLKAKDLLAMLRDSESLLILFSNEIRLASMRSLREKVNKCITELDEDETDVKESIAIAHNNAAAQIARLKQQEDEAVAQAKARRAAFQCSYAERITAMVANFHAKEATQIQQPSSDAAAETVLLFFASFMKSVIMLVFGISCRLYATLWRQDFSSDQAN